jgi:hypothetical protein
MGLSKQFYLFISNKHCPILKIGYTKQIVFERQKTKLSSGKLENSEKIVQVGVSLLCYHLLLMFLTVEHNS